MSMVDLSIREKICQKFIFGVNSDNIDILIDLIQEYAIGGVILYKKNYNSYDEMIDVIKRLKLANVKNKIPLFISIDQEGGKVNRMPKEFENIKNVYDLSKTNIDLVTKASNITGKMLHESGINMNFSPVLDIYNGNFRNKALYKRCFYGDEKSVSNYANEYVKGLTSNKVVSVVKHFPGHGVSSVDSHYVIPYVYNYNKIFDKHIKPFEEVMNNGVDALMVGHIVIRKFTNFVPASLSYRFINNYLRDRYKFQGLVITDEIGMLKHNLIYRWFCEKWAMLSGSDIILMKLNDKNSAINLINKYITVVNKGSNQLKLLDDSVSRIIKIKNKYNISDNVSDIGCDVELINEEIIKINNKAL